MADLLIGSCPGLPTWQRQLFRERAIEPFFADCCVPAYRGPLRPPEGPAGMAVVSTAMRAAIRASGRSKKRGGAGAHSKAGSGGGGDSIQGEAHTPADVECAEQQARDEPTGAVDGSWNDGEGAERARWMKRAPPQPIEPIVGTSAALSNVTIGVLGGSISAGEGVPKGQGWVDVLPGLLPGVRVVNRAVRATGVSHAAFCLDTLLPERVDAIVLEFAVNDAWYAATSSFAPAPASAPSSSVHASALDPRPSMERVLRHLRSSRPGVAIVLLYLCRGGRPLWDWRNGPSCPKLSSWLPHAFNASQDARCDSLYTDVARAYGVREVHLSDYNLEQSCWSFGVHPDALGHMSAARGVAEALLGALTSRRGTVGSHPFALPARLFPAPSWDMDETRPLSGAWTCRMCNNPHAPGPVCAALPAAGADVHPPPTGFSHWIHHRKGRSRAGWLANTTGARIAFAVEGRSRVLAAFLCSHFDVGTAALYLLPQALAASSPASAATALGGAIASVRVDLHWSSSTSQQCIVDVGNSGEGANLLIVVANHEDGHRVAGTPSSTSASPSPSSDLRRHGHESRQVLLYGVFTHALGYT